MIPNSLEDRGFRRKAKAVNWLKDTQENSMEKHYNCGQIPKPLVFWQGNLCRISNGEQHAYKTQL